MSILGPGKQIFGMAAHANAQQTHHKTLVPQGFSAMKVDLEMLSDC
jgi:hypothetical protein